MKYGVVVGDVEDGFGREFAEEVGALFLPVEVKIYKPEREVKPILKLDDCVEENLEGLKGNVLLALRDIRFADRKSEPDSNMYLRTCELTIDAIRDIAEPACIDVLMPYMYYARQDERFQRGEPLSLKRIADDIASWGIRRLFTYHSHLLGREEKRLQDYFGKGVEVHDIGLANVFADVLKSKYAVREPVVVNPDGDSPERVKDMSGQFENSTFSWVKQGRDRQTGEKKVLRSGLTFYETDGRDAIIYDDMTKSGGTLIRAYKIVLGHRPKRIFIVVGHMVGEEPVKRLGSLVEESRVEAVLTSDSFRTPYGTELGKYFNEHIEEIHTAPFIADYIKKV